MTKRFRSLESAELKTQFLEKARPAKNGKPAPRRRQEKEIIQLIESMLNKSDFDFNFDVDEIKSSPLGQALKTPRLLSELLERKDLDVNLTDKEGKTVIFLAVESQLQPRKRIEILERFNKARVKIDTTDIHGRTPLLLAALLQQWDTVQFFVDEWDAGLDLEDNEKCTPLHYAITQGRADAVQYILQKKVNIDRRGHDDQTPLLTAIKLKEGTERTMIIKYLIESGANPNLKDCKQHTPLSYAVSHLDVEAFGQLLGSKDHAINVDHRVNGRTALSLAAECEAICIMKKLIPIAEINTQDDTTGRTPLTWAVEKGSKSAVTTLLEVRTLVKVDCPDHQGRTPFSVAASNGNVKIMSLLLDYGADPHIEDDESHSSFWWLLKSRTQEQTYPQTSLQDLIERLPDPDRQDSNGRTWLSWAAEYGDEEVVEQLLKNNKVRASQTDCVIGQIDTFARTPLIWAVEQSHYSLVSLITSTRKDKSSLIYLMKSSHVLGHERALDLFKKLLLFGDESITEDKDNEGNTPLHLICLREYHHFMKPLLAAKPVFFSRNHDGRMPLQVALDKRNKRAVDLLLELMNQVEIEPVKSVDWLKLGSGDNPWVWLSEIAPERGFRYDLTGKINYDMLSDNGPRRVW
jgi:ankyrin repeat protein